MHVSFAGRFIVNAAKRMGATSVSIQKYWTFVDFDREDYAECFLTWSRNKGYDDLCGINRNRPGVKFEVAVRNPK